MLDLGLRQKRVLLAGTGAGIGRACALAFAEAGARVACMDLDQGRADEVANALRAAGAEALVLQADVRRREDVATAVELAARGFGGIDVCVDIIGEARWGRVLELTDGDWNDSFDLSSRYRCAPERPHFIGAVDVLASTPPSTGLRAGFETPPREGGSSGRTEKCLSF